MLNRQALFAAIEEAAGCTGAGEQVGLLIVRDRRFRDYENLFGYDAGEALVTAFERRLQAALRDQDRTVRIGECDFAAVLPGLTGSPHAELAAAKVARVFEAPLQADGQLMRIRALVGASSAPAAALSVAQLCRSADRACDAASDTRGRYALLDESDAGAGPLLHYDRLFAGVHGNQLAVSLQPIFELHNGALKGFESLSRWSADEGGAVPPTVFVPMCERSGLIDELTRWNVNATLRLCAPRLARDRRLTCSINLSPKALLEPGFVERLQAALRIWDVRPESVIAEITETAFVDDLDAISQRLAELHEAGLGISIDDFGTGYSSLSYLKRFPVTELKIDGSFIRDLTHEWRSARLVASMIDMAHRLGAVAVAEGIEDQATVDALKAAGCDHGQGYWLGPPRPAEEVLSATDAHAIIG